MRKKCSNNSSDFNKTVRDTPIKFPEKIKYVQCCWREITYIKVDEDHDDNK